MPCEHPIDSHIREKIALFCNVPRKHVIENRDMPTLYEDSTCSGKRGPGGDCNQAVALEMQRAGSYRLGSDGGGATAIWAGQWTLRW